MNIQSVIEDIQKHAPKSIIISTDPSEIPSYPLSPGVKTPVRRRSNAIGLVLLAQPTRSGKDAILSVPDALGINGESQIGLSRANRIMPPGQTSIPQSTKSDEESCTLCQEAKSHPKPSNAYAVDNQRAFGPLLHKVVASKKHIIRLGDATLAELQDATELFLEFGKRNLQPKGGDLDGLTIGMNCGKYILCGASQPHFHYQVTGLGKANYNAGDRLGALCQSYRQAHAGADYLEDYERAVRQADLVVAEREHLALAFVPISPRFKNEVQIMLLRKQAGNILDTTPDERAAISDLQRQIMERFDHLGCEALNQVWYMTRFSAKNDYGQRLIISLCPRASVIAFYELAGNNVIDSLPWKAAQGIREAAPPPKKHEP